MQPLLSGKTLLIISSCGEFGFQSGGIREHMSHLTPHIRTLSQYLGIDTIYEIASEYQEFSDVWYQNSLHHAYDQAELIAKKLAHSCK